MTSRFVRIVLNCLLLLGLAGPSFAARRSSLAGNLLIPDRDDIFFFPQLVSQHKRMVTFDIGQDANLGSGGMVFGNEDLTFGAFAHRGDFMGALPTAFLNDGDADFINAPGTGQASGIGLGRGSLGLGNPALLPALQWIDAVLGWEAAGVPWGLRLSVGRNSDDPAGANKNSVTGFNAVVGLHMAALGGTDLSGEFSLAKAKAELGAVTESTPLGFALGLRHTAADQSDALQLGWLGLFSWGSANVDVTPTGGTKTTTDNNQLNLLAGVGPVYHPNDRTNVAMYGTVEYLRHKSEAGTPTVTTTNTNFVLPGWHIGAEVEIASWLQARAGLRSRFAFNTDKTAGGATPGEDKDNSLDFRWTSGVGVHFNNLHVDGFFDPSVLTNGTAVLGTNGHRTFGMVTASYDF